MSPSQPAPGATPEANEPTVSVPGKFKNDPDDPTSPNEAIERSRRALRPNPLPSAAVGNPADDKPQAPAAEGGEDE
jgi:hypothetical protein